MHLIGLARLGKDADIRFLQDGTPVANLALAFNYGKKDADNKRPTQWIDAALFGERANKLQQWLVKGQQFEVHLVDPHIESYTARDGTQGTKLVAMVNHIEFAGSAPQQAGQQPAQNQPAQNQQGSSQRNAYQDQKSGARPAPAPQQRGAADTFDDLDAPF